MRKSTTLAILAILLFKFMLDLSYCLIVSRVWGYAGFSLQFNPLKYGESFILLAVVIALLPKSPKKLSHIILWLLFLFSFIPLLTIFALKNEARAFIYAVSCFWILILLLNRMPAFEIKRIERSKTIASLIMIITTLFIIIMIKLFYNFSTNFDLSKVYSVREQFSAIKIPLMGYLLVWSGYVINPFFYGLFFRNKKFIAAGLIFLLQVLLFSVSGNKSFLFALVLVSFLMWTMTRRNPLACITVGFTMAIIAGLSSYFLVGDIWITSLFARRTLLDQAQQSFFYYSFFKKHDFLYLSQHSFFNLFTSYPYDLDPPHLISRYFYGTAGQNANTGIVGDAFMNFGFPGFFLWGLALAIILKIYDSCAQGKDKLIAISTVVMPSLSLINSPLLTDLLTHGMLVSWMLLFLLPKVETSRYKLVSS